MPLFSKHPVHGKAKNPLSPPALSGPAVKYRKYFQYKRFRLSKPKTGRETGKTEVIRSDSKKREPEGGSIPEKEIGSTQKKADGYINVPKSRRLTPSNMTCPKKN